MGQKHPYSGLTDQQEHVLLSSGWKETGFESLPPPWWDGQDGNKLYTPEKAYEECCRRIKLTSKEQI